MLFINPSVASALPSLSHDYRFCVAKIRRSRVTSPPPARGYSLGPWQGLKLPPPLPTEASTPHPENLRRRVLALELDKMCLSSAYITHSLTLPFATTELTSSQIVHRDVCAYAVPESRFRVARVS